jgi:hypothetical protein
MLDPRVRQRFAEGCRGPAACCAAKAFWVVGPSLPWAMTTRVAVCGLWVRLFAFYYFRKRGVCPHY